MFSDFTEAISKIIESEFATNKNFIQEWLHYPHKKNTKLERPKEHDQLQMSSDEE